MKHQFSYIQDVLNVRVLVLHCAKFVLVVLVDQIRQPLLHPKNEQKSISPISTNVPFRYPLEMSVRKPSVFWCFQEI